MKSVIIFLFSAIIYILASSLYAHAKDTIRYIEGPVFAKIIRIVDGDTVLVDATPWPSHTIRVYVRLRNIDTPELKSKCKRERIAAHHAKHALSKMIDGNTITLRRISGGKYYGRILADIETLSGINASDQMLKIGHARPYQKGKRANFCQTS
ncbi:thermonuclease family protein [Lentilitoribacter sp. Alg239-R112]|jgi:endonuclease YncB( thermonuclease family)|uniref:thermonuclease family protein n=1 Tax=Lentilitoribacter sp. Alg239-R112 TaxID=2305987 RepID=UPI0013A6B333|nr:thermonuclease family protein [Lentilitoribacter sp. Alg239-R112]